MSKHAPEEVGGNMTDLKKLRELASKSCFDRDNSSSLDAFQEAANPETVIALLDKVEATESLNSSLYSEIRRLRSQLAEYENDDELKVNHE